MYNAWLFSHVTGRIWAYWEGLKFDLSPFSIKMNCFLNTLAGWTNKEDRVYSLGPGQDQAIKQILRGTLYSDPVWLQLKTSEGVQPLMYPELIRIVCKEEAQLEEKGQEFSTKLKSRYKKEKARGMCGGSQASSRSCRLQWGSCSVHFRERISCWATYEYSTLPGTLPGLHGVPWWHIAFSYGRSPSGIDELFHPAYAILAWLQPSTNTY